MPLHFDTAEYTARQARATRAVQDAGLDALILFAPESHYWLCGYDTFGFAMFQAMVLTAQGDLHLMTRMPDRLQARHTSTLTEGQIHVWPQYEGSNPAAHLKDLLARLGVAGKRLGFESQTCGLTDHNGQLLRAALPGLADHSDLIRALRRVKAPAEIAWPPCKARCSGAGATTRAMNSSSARAPARCCAATTRGAAIWTRGTR